MELLERAELLLAKAKDDETLLEEIIFNEKIRDEIIGFHAQQAAKSPSQEKSCLFLPSSRS